MLHFQCHSEKEANEPAKSTRNFITTPARHNRLISLHEECHNLAGMEELYELINFSL